MGIVGPVKAAHHNRQGMGAGSHARNAMGHNQNN